MEVTYFALSLSFYYLLHSVLADTKVKTALTQSFLPFRYYRIFFNFLSIILLLPIFALFLKAKKQLLFNSNWFTEGLGLILILIGFGLMMLALRQYNLAEFSGSYQLKHNESPKSAQLKVSGINQYVRHPLYFSMLLISWGLVFYFPFTTVLVFTIITNLYIIIGTRLEENKLVIDFGKAYQDYQLRVPMLLPLKFLNKTIEK